MLLPYPDALEAATALQAGARGESLPTEGVFFANGDWANEAGAAFAEECASDLAN
jgi:hypothetical protein